MQIRNGIISAIAGASLLGGAGVAALVSTGGSSAAPLAGTASLTAASAPVAPAPPAPASPVAPTAVAPTPAQACTTAADDGGWPAYTQGEPAGFSAGSAAGVYLWHDESGWHLRVTHQNDHHQVYAGRLETGGQFADVDAVKLEGNDTLRVGPDKHVIEFRFNNYGGVDGIDFRTHCAGAINFDLRADGAKLNPTEVYVGHGSVNPPAVPFDIDRTA